MIKKSTQEKCTTGKDKNFVDVNQVTSKDSSILIGPNFENSKNISTDDTAIDPLMNNAISIFGKSNSTCYNAAPVAVASRMRNLQDVCSIINKSTHEKSTTKMD